MSTIFFITITVIIMISFNALYVASEFATVAARRTRISQLAGEGNRMAQRLLPIMEDSAELDKYVATCQLGITVSSLVLGIYGENVIAQQLHTSFTWLPEATAVITVLVFITVLQVIFGELLPKSVAVQYPEDVAQSPIILFPMLISLFLFYYPIKFFNGSGALILRLIGRKIEKKGAVHSPKEIELLVTESHEVGLLEDSERQMLRNAFRMRELTARQVMIHRTKLVAAPADTNIDELINMAIEAGYSRIPLYTNSIDNIKGFVHVKDLFRLHIQEQSSVTSIQREVIHVPETLPVADVWEKLNQKRKYLAVVFDEYGGTAGIITLEDLIEEIFGELQDEFDDETALIARDQEGRIYLRGDLLVTDVNEYLELNLPTEADTLSGLIFSTLGGAPNEGAQITINDTAIRVEVMEDLGVAEVSLKLPVDDRVSNFTEWEVADHE